MLANYRVASRETLPRHYRGSFRYSGVAFPIPPPRHPSCRYSRDTTAYMTCNVNHASHTQSIIIIACYGLALPFIRSYI
eukprot:6209418-Pleurochrysis_carterae.AAC.1